MAAWEYTVFRAWNGHVLSWTDPKGAVTETAVVQNDRHDLISKTESHRTLTQYLNDMGSEGWELVSLSAMETVNSQVGDRVNWTVPMIMRGVFKRQVGA